MPLTCCSNQDLGFSVCSEKFFGTYIFHPCSGELLLRERVKAFAASLFLAIFALCTVHIVAYFKYKNKTISVLDASNKVDKNTYLNWLKSRADQKNAVAQFKYAKELPRGGKEQGKIRESYLEESAKNHYAPAQFEWHVRLKKKKGKEKEANEKAAFEFCKKSALQGYLPAQIDLAAIYEKGLLGVAKNAKEALAWFLKAANQTSSKDTANLADAQFRLSQVYEEGAIVKKDPEEAKKWLVKAAENGLKIAIERCHKDKIPFKAKEVSAA